MTLRYRLFLLIAIALLLSACGGQQATATLVPTLAPPTARVTAVSQAVSSPTSPPPASPTATPPPVPTASATPAPSPTSTPVPATATPTATPQPESFRFVVCGDNRGGDEVYRQILGRAVDEGSDFLINVGDIVNRGEVEQLEHMRDLMAEYPLPIFIAPGNHDLLDGSLHNFMSVFEPPAPSYSFDRGQVHLVILNSSWGGLSDEQLDWLHVDLEKSEQPVTMVFLHHPPFDPVGTDHIMAFGQDAFMALIKQHGVEYVFAGHIHSFDYELRDGTHYYITGGAGAPLYPHYQRDAFYHYLRVEVSGEQVEVELVRLD